MMPFYYFGTLLVHRRMTELRVVFKKFGMVRKIAKIIATTQKAQEIANFLCEIAIVCTFLQRLAQIQEIVLSESTMRHNCQTVRRKTALTELTTSCS